MNIKIIAAAGAILSILGGSALAHSWYATRCCGGQDCFPIDVSAVTETSTGWRVDYSSPDWGSVHETVDRSQAEPSLDGQYHMCLKPPTALVRIRCFYAPANV